MAVLMAIAVVGMVISCFLMPVEDSGVLVSGLPWLSHVLALLCLVLVAFSLGYVNTNSYLFTSDSSMLYLPYLLSVLVLPGAVSLTVYHMSALLVLWGMFYAVRYLNAETLRFDLLFISVLTSGVAAMMVPQLLYVEIFLFLYCLVSRGQDLSRFLLSGLAAAALPWIYILSWMYFFPDSLGLDYLADFRRSLGFSLPSLSSMALSDAVLSCFALLLVIRALLFVSVKNRERNKAQKNAFGLSVALSVMSVLTVIFCRTGASPLIVMVAGVPVSLSVFDFFTNGRGKEPAIWAALLLVLTVSLRVLDLLPVF